MSDLSVALQNKAQALADLHGPSMTSSMTEAEIFTFLVTQTSNSEVAAEAAKLIRGAVKVVSEARISGSLENSTEFWEKHDADAQARNLAILNEDYEIKEARVAAGGYSRGHDSSDDRGDQETG